MKSTLKDRIQEFTKLYQNTHFLARENMLERFLEQELNTQASSIVIDSKHLCSMQDAAIQAWQNLPVNSTYHGNTLTTLAFCWTTAVLQYLRSKDLLHITIAVDKGIKE